ncbi:MAG: bacteriohemerythrin [Bacillota bacterium]
MQYVKWLDEKYSVNIQHIDNQHKKLVEIVNQAFRAKMDKSGRGSTLQILEQLDQYAKSHFLEEESLLRAHNYPALEAHQAAHANFITKVKEYTADLNSDGEALSDDILIFLKDWLLNHIMLMDKSYSTFLNNLGVY